MAFSSALGRKQAGWDLTHLSAKYPWLRVDAATIEEFRSPFHWIDVPPKPKPQTLPPRQQQQPHVDESEDGEEPDSSDGSGQQSDTDERKESLHFSLSGRKVTASRSTKRKQQHKTPNKKKSKYNSERWEKQQQQQRQVHQPAANTNTPAPKTHALSSTATIGRSVNRIPSIVHERIAAAGPGSPSSLVLTLPETDALYQALTFPVEQQRKKVRKRPEKKPHNILSLRCALWTNQPASSP